VFDMYVFQPIEGIRGGRGEDSVSCICLPVSPSQNPCYMHFFVRLGVCMRVWCVRVWCVCVGVCVCVLRVFCACVQCGVCV